MLPTAPECTTLHRLTCEKVVSEDRFAFNCKCADNRSRLYWTGLGFVYLSRCGRLYCPDLGGCLALGLSAAGLVTVRFQDHNINYPLIIWDRVIVARSMDQCTVYSCVH